MATTKAASTTKKTPAKKSSAAKATSSVKSAPVAASKNTFAGHVQQSVRSLSLWRALAAEFIGTFLLASVVIAGQGQPIFVLFALVGIILLVGALSGAHVNPAITIGAWVTRRIGWLRAVGYIIAQCLGAALALVVLSGFIGGFPLDAQAAAFGQAAPSLFTAADYAAYFGKEWYVFFAELLGTAILGFAIANVTREKQDRVAAAFTGGLGIFIALMIATIAAGYVSATTAINPAIAIALQSFDWAVADKVAFTVWPFAIYAIAPAIGAVAGFVLHDLLSPKAVK